MEFFYDDQNSAVGSASGAPDDKEIRERIERVREMEAAMERLQKAFSDDRPAREFSDAVRNDLARLDSYYHAEWIEDYEADERGEFPPDLKRGVLSQDGLYDLLAEAQERLDEERLIEERPDEERDSEENSSSVIQ